VRLRVQIRGPNLIVSVLGRGSRHALRIPPIRVEGHRLDPQHLQVSVYRGNERLSKIAMSLLPSLSSRQRDGVLFSPHWPPTSASQEQLPSNLHTGIHVNFYTNMVSDRVGDKPQTLIRSLTPRSRSGQGL
jgi:hypothetical protein